MPKMPDYAEFERDFRDVLMPMPPVTVRMSPASAFAILCGLQLALRHPGFPEKMRPVTEGFARQLQDLCSLTPVLMLVCQAGWYQEYDRPLDEDGRGRSGDYPDA